ncbi:CaiB/BaiF CoA transferase family protein [Acuticoccus sp.]|uniref:CaiB/BaiF CoA transferase family protein n=1 Tax=Acuticoccus sp. TaxID=1904378 RepID=UPI003B52E26B
MALPLEGVRVLDFGHTVMGPSAGLILADLGADVVKIEPAPDGEPTRRLTGFGSGYFGFLNRNKRSVAIDLKSAEGQAVAHRLVAGADVLLENFAPGTMDRLGLSRMRVAELNPRLVYTSLKGFLPGPYERRLALDEVVQMMAGLAYMTGPPGRPLRAGASVVDITGGMFAVIGILCALRTRDAGGQAASVDTALFETCVFLMGQHLAYASQTDEKVPPMPARRSAWAIYELFALADGGQLFVGITTDAHWRRFCAALGRDDLAADPSLATNNQRVEARARLVPIVADVFGALCAAEAIALCEAARIPFAPIATPEDLFEDAHLAATGGLMLTVMPDGTRTRLPRLPLAIAGVDLTLRSDPPALGADTAAVLVDAGLSADEVADLAARRVVVDGRADQAARG